MAIYHVKSKFSKKKDPLKGMRKHEREEYLSWCAKIGADSKQEIFSTVQMPKNIPPRGRDKEYKSLNNGVDSTFAVKKDNPHYTGDNILGIGTLHKSNAIPIFSPKEAQEISKMRR